MSEKRYMTVNEYAKKKGVSNKTVYNWMESGKIRKNRIKKILSITLIKV